MLTSIKTLQKVKKIEENYYPLIFKQISSPDLDYIEYTGFQSEPSPSESWKPFPGGRSWGGPAGNAWIRGVVEVPSEFQGEDLFLQFNCGAVETLVQVDGIYKGLFNNLQTEEGTRANHHTVRILSSKEKKKSVSLLLQAYAGHPCVGTMPYDEREATSKKPETYLKKMLWCRVVQKRDWVKSFVFELRTLRLLAEATHDSFLQGKIYKILTEIFAIVDQTPLQQEKEMKELLSRARKLMRPIFEMGSSNYAPRAGIIGHSHMDTAWLWTSEETIRKCARTYSAALNYMEQYPDYLFLQSSPIHAEMMRKHYPEIFKGIKQRIAEGRWEPNGGMYVEADCNIPSGESLVRQFLKGQRYTQKHFNYTADTFWLPDTFGYSAALPQILKGCSIKYFCTTKLSWNETNLFPYDTFLWKGIDGSSVTVHFNDTHGSPHPDNLIEKLYGKKSALENGSGVRHTDVNDSRLISFGIGDGGGGPDFDMIEEAELSRNLPGCPKAEYTTVSNFMKNLSERSTNLPVYNGELYLELHRGTLTQMAAIKRYNRKLETALLTIEKLFSLALMQQISVSLTHLDFQKVEEAYDILLLNQFHDILPGTSIPEENDRAMRDYKIAYDSIGELTKDFLSRATTKNPSDITIFNPLTWEIKGSVIIREEELPLSQGKIETNRSQCYKDLKGKQLTILGGLHLPALGLTAIPISTISEKSQELSVVEKSLLDGSFSNGVFTWDGKNLDTPFYKITIDDNGYLTSLYDKEARREVRGNGTPLGTLYFGEDIPALWDNWDIDYDQHLKMKPLKNRTSIEVISAGKLAFVIRQHFELSKTSSLIQDMRFYADNRSVEFETQVDWNEKQRLLKVSFDLNVKSSVVKNEIQFGHLDRPTHENTSFEKTKFEVSNHKWSDLSESRYGVAILNDCKYGISVKDSDMQLTLLKSGGHPDDTCDRGVHYFTYAILPHLGNFSASAVVLPAYELNTSFPVVLGTAPTTEKPFLRVREDNIIFETLKPEAKAFEDGRFIESTTTAILRGYEAEGTQTRVKISFAKNPKKIIETDLLENGRKEITIEGNEIEVIFQPFEIKTYAITF